MRCAKKVPSMAHDMQLPLVSLLTKHNEAFEVISVHHSTCHILGAQHSSSFVLIFRVINLNFKINMILFFSHIWQIVTDFVCTHFL